ncbi:hypothetical protein GCM10010218_55760 [Streptomyces mashuensis]|uniref:Erythromycin esterase n=1 Tax=Streptomyces mashuensis TaxID=33904 RepID=A0A919B854_9ACTN|nr:erythromycin esterase family protein [Streptomyces mashuensis]GHF67130.1 hypothetical protein GCM10010218_55760 [Streptomyces mashuensis]
MTQRSLPLSRRSLLRGIAVPAVALTLAPPALAGNAAATGRSPHGDSVPAAFRRYAHPLRSTDPGGRGDDLAPFAALTRGATVVGLGEASHGSKELFDVKHRVFRELVRREGFSAFAMEISWSAGVRLDTCVRTGEGDLRQIMREEFQDGYSLLNNEELLRLFTWMREHNRTAARPVRVVGLDFSDAGPEQYDRILAWAGRHASGLVPALRSRYAAFRALPGGVAARLAAYGALPLDRRRAMERDAKAAYEMLARADARDPFVLQEARMLAEMATEFAFDTGDPAQAAALNRHRDRTMAETVVWWHRHTGDRVVASAHDGHVSRTSVMPAVYPVTMGADLRDLLGRDYLAVGTALHSGAYRARTATGETGVFGVGPAAPGSNEDTLDRVDRRDFFLDLRAATRDPALAGWLDTERPTYVIPGRHPNQPTAPMALGRAYDALLYLHTVHASVPLPGAGR